MNEVEHSPEVLQADLERVRRLARMLDSEFQVAGIPVGWDAIIGLVPLLGDFVTLLIGVYPLVIARKHKLGGKVLQARMAANLAIDWLIGEIPLAGDLFDVFYRANLKNLALLERAAEKRLRG